MYQIELHQTSLLRKGTQLFIGMDISVLCNNIDPNGSIEVIPMLSCDKHCQELPLVIINGKERHRNFKHMTGYFKKYQIYKAIQGVNDSMLWCSYQLHIPYQEWMNNAGVSLVAN